MRPPGARPRRGRCAVRPWARLDNKSNGGGVSAARRGGPGRGVSSGSVAQWQSSRLLSGSVEVRPLPGPPANRRQIEKASFRGRSSGRTASFEVAEAGSSPAPGTMRFTIPSAPRGPDGQVICARSLTIDVHSCFHVRWRRRAPARGGGSREERYPCKVDIGVRVPAAPPPHYIERGSGRSHSLRGWVRREKEKNETW